MEDESDEVVEVLKHKLEEEVKWYLVKWKNDSENTWIPEDNFNTMEIVNKYYDRINNHRPAKKHWKTREKEEKAAKTTLSKELTSEKLAVRTRKTTKINLFEILSILGIIFFLFGQITGSSITDDFKFCDVSQDMNILDVNQMCKKQVSVNFDKGREREAIILSKMHDIIDGIAYECSKRRHIRINEETIFFQKHIDAYSEDILLEKMDCEIMLLTKKCDEYKMECINNNCIYSGSPKSEFAWGRRIKTTNYSCSITPIHIQARTPYQHLFGKKCSATDGYCQKGNSIIIWKYNEVFHACPFAQIAETKLLEMNKNDSRLFGVLISKMNHWLFNVSYVNYGF